MSDSDYAEVASVNVADYLLERDRLVPKEGDLVDEVSEQHLRASDLRDVIDALITCRRDIKLLRQARYRMRVDHEHTLLPTDATVDYRDAVCNCGARAHVVDQDAAEIWHAVHVRWPDESPAELATRMKASLRDPNELHT